MSSEVYNQIPINMDSLRVKRLLVAQVLRIKEQKQPLEVHSQVWRTHLSVYIIYKKHSRTNTMKVLYPPDPRNPHPSQDQTWRLNNHHGNWPIAFKHKFVMDMFLC